MGLIKYIHGEWKGACWWICSFAFPIAALEGLASAAFVCMGLRRRRLDGVIKRKKSIPSDLTPSCIFIMFWDAQIPIWDNNANEFYRRIKTFERKKNTTWVCHTISLQFIMLILLKNDILLWRFISCPGGRPTMHSNSGFKYCTRIYSNYGSLRIWANVRKPSPKTNLLVGADI